MPAGVTAEHEARIECVEVADGGMEYAAACGCGYRTSSVPDQAKAQMAAYFHVGDVAREGAPAVLPACPEWCSVAGLSRFGHDFDPERVEGGFGYSRHHETYIGVSSVSQLETWQGPGSVTLAAALVWVEGKDPVPADEARAIAADLIAAAELAERINTADEAAQR